MKSATIDLKNDQLAGCMQYNNTDCNNNNLNACTLELKGSYATILVFLGISGNDVNSFTHIINIMVLFTPLHIVNKIQ